MAHQADFISRFFDLTPSLDLDYVTWLFEHDWHDEATVPAFVGIGLKNKVGTTVRLAASRWSSEILRRQR
ncbi:MAG: hypothetical protein H6832_18835 [Planctomycetes bacterium]|nr:hypothetical protein [Planctomycetota bacterium]MCB9920466.1 hypothetical protein [Planctomycetota bacterium]